jgi:hypothetical protein
MENRSAFGGQSSSGSGQQHDTRPEWFVAIGEKSVGPMGAAEVYERIVAGELSWISYVWKEGMSGWQRVCDVPAFQAAVPPPPAAKPQVQPPAPPTKKIQPKEWFLYFNDSQQGPYSEDEVIGLVGVGKIDGEAFAWKDGMSGWEPLSALSLFSSKLSAPTAGGAPSSSSAPAVSEREKRAYARKPILAKVMIVEGDQLIVGVARDISIGGMQVLSDFVPTTPGARLKLNVSAPDLTNPEFSPFVAEGVVVRLHQDRRGFSFRFDELSSNTRQTIERILQG